SVPAPTDIYTLSLHDALPISVQMNPRVMRSPGSRQARKRGIRFPPPTPPARRASRRLPAAAFRLRARALGIGGFETKLPCRRPRSEEHTSELQSRSDLVCRLL